MDNFLFFVIELIKRLLPIKIIGKSLGKLTIIES